MPADLWPACQEVIKTGIKCGQMDKTITSEEGSCYAAPDNC